MKSVYGTQLSISNTEIHDELEPLRGYTLKVIDIRKDWPKLLATISKSVEIQKAMESAYQNFQEGLKLKDFKYKKAINGAWSYSDINHGLYPYILTTTNSIFEYEQLEWVVQANKLEKEIMKNLSSLIKKCKLQSQTHNLLENLYRIREQLLLLYPPRINQPETWRPENSAKWTCQWVIKLAKIFYNDKSKNWQIISTENHSIVVGLSDNKTAYLIDLILLTTNPTKILAYLKKKLYS
mgnify:CR=1 FL=1